MSVALPVSRADEQRGLLLGVIGVAIFSLTFPATRLAVVSLDPFFVSLGRCLVAALPATAFLAMRRDAWPTLSQVKRLIWVIAGVVIGFPVLTTWALTRVPATHGAVVVGLLPLATAIAGSVLDGERPSRRFWMVALLGAALVAVFVIIEGAEASQSFELADLALLAAVVAGGVGYAEGARLSRELGGRQVISWALVLAAPLLLPVVVWLAWNQGVRGTPSAWAGFAYVALMSQYLGFFVWYKGLALGGIARVSQVQLLQPFLSIVAAGLLLGEPVTLTVLGFAAAVVATVALGRRMPVSAASV